MKIETCVSSPDDALEKYRPSASGVHWDLVASGFWSEDMYHCGHIAYFLAQLGPGHWIMDAVERNAELDGVTAEDVEEGRLNDDQIQAMWGKTLEEAQNQIYQRIVAVCTDAPPDITSKEIADILYAHICDAGGKDITEPDDRDGLLVI
jgi:hypothetical protein